MSDNIPTPPKKPVNAYSYYVESRMSELKSRGAKPNEIFKICGKDWKDLDEPSKQDFQQKYQNSMKNYNKELNEWENKTGMSLGAYKKAARGAKVTRNSKVVAEKDNSYVNVAVPVELAEIVHKMIDAFLEK